MFGGVQVVRPLGAGGSGSVFVARQPDGSPCALKILSGPLGGGARRARFEREAAIGKTFDHPGLGRVFRYGEDEARPYLIMELLEGARPLDAYVAEERLDPGGIALLLAQVAEAVATAHAAGVVHRDLKPDNILVTPSGQPKVIDFGLARDLDRTRLTQSGATLGTVPYMAPEQIRGDTAHADARTDVYALGVILYQLLSGELPFTGETAIELMRQILEAPPPALPTGGDRRAARLATIALKALAKAPDDRYPTALTLAHDLEAVRTGSAISAEQEQSEQFQAQLLRGLGALIVGLVVVLGFLLARSRAPLSSDQVDARAAALSAQVREALETEGDLASTAPLASELLLALAELERGAPKRPRRQRSPDAPEPAPTPLRLAAVQVRALAGLASLARGELTPAKAALAGLSGDDLALAALRGGVSVHEHGDPRAAVTLLTRAIEGGLLRVDLRAWRAEARLAGGRSAPRDVRADLAVVQRVRGELLPRELILRVRLSLAEGDTDEAARRLKALAEHATPELRWRVALVAVQKHLELKPTQAEACLAGLTPVGRPPESDYVARRALSLVARELGAQPGPLTPERAAATAAWIRISAACGGELPQRLADRLAPHVLGLVQNPHAELAAALANARPDDAKLQREVGLLVHRFRSSKGKRLMLPFLQRAIDQTADRRLRDKLEVHRLTAIASINDSLHDPLDRAEAQQARQRLDLLLTRPPPDAVHHAELLAARSRLARRLGDLPAALVDIRAALALHVGPAFHYFLGETLRAQGDTLGALRAYGSYIDEAQDSSDRFLRAVVFVYETALKQKNTPLAYKAVRKLLKLRADAPGWWVRRAALELASGRASEARDSLRLAAELAPRDRHVRAIADRFRKLVGPAPAPARVADLVRELDRIRALRQRATP